jgi:hypothetical protein
MTDFELARRQVQELLDASGGDSDLLYRAIRIAEHTAVDVDGYTEIQALAYQLQRLALAEITGNLRYRI